MNPELWWEFLTSPGFGGAAALLAAGVAAAVGYSQYRLTREHRAREQWWATLTWVYDRAVVDQSGRRPLAQAVTVGVLDRLFDQVKRSDSLSRQRWGPEAEAVAALADMFVETHNRDSAGVESPALILLNDLQAELTGRGLGRRARAVAYRREALAALERLLGKFAADDSPDFGDNVNEVRTGLNGLVVRIEYRESAPPSPGPTKAALAAIHAKYRTPVLFMLNQPVDPLSAESAEAYPVHMVTWRDQSDDPALANALRQMGANLR